MALSGRIYWAHETAQCYICVKALKALLPVRGGPEFCSACREYNAFVGSVAEETKRWRQRQAAAMAEQLQLDEESLQRLQAASRHVKVESLIPFPFRVELCPCNHACISALSLSAHCALHCVVFRIVAQHSGLQCFLGVITMTAPKVICAGA